MYTFCPFDAYIITYNSTTSEIIKTTIFQVSLTESLGDTLEKFIFWLIEQKHIELVTLSQGFSRTWWLIRLITFVIVKISPSFPPLELQNSLFSRKNVTKELRNARISHISYKLHYNISKQNQYTNRRFLVLSHSYIVP